MEVICSMVVSVDGFIADTDGRSVSTDYNWRAFQKEAHDFDNFIVGRRTYITSIPALSQVDCALKIVVSSKDTRMIKGFTLAHSPQEALELLRAKVKYGYLVGGAGVNTAFAASGLIDVLTLTVEPKLVGQGRALFDSPLKQNLDLVSSEQLPEGRIKLTYKLSNDPRSLD